MEGINYYRKLFPQMVEESAEFRAKMLAELEECQRNLLHICKEHSKAFNTSLTTASL